MVTVIALGGNALLQRGQEGTLREQIKNAEKAMKPVASLFKNGEHIVLTHGNGPQVGAIVIQQQSKEVPGMPLNVAVAESQGLIGYILQKTLANYGVPSATIVTQVLVDANDPAFKNPTKPVGPFFEKPQDGMIEDSGRGWRKVVASPKPMKILEINVIKSVSEKALAICCGGGGIPVVRHEDHYDGIEAVIDKDLCAELLARELNATKLIILTDVDGLYKNYGKTNAELISALTVAEAKKLLPSLAAGSMRPKIEACILFAEKGGEAIICSLEQLPQALKGKAGTRIHKE